MEVINKATASQASPEFVIHIATIAITADSTHEKKQQKRSTLTTKASPITRDWDQSTTNQGCSTIMSSSKRQDQLERLIQKHLLISYEERAEIIICQSCLHFSKRHSSSDTCGWRGEAVSPQKITWTSWAGSGKPWKTPSSATEFRASRMKYLPETSSPMVHEDFDNKSSERDCSTSAARNIKLMPFERMLGETRTELIANIITY